ncbi:putative membrane protein [Leptolyngbyaceae cyanobacterium JSC-12]|nr:putative membrane protein [Leptolyngbyaceae cyanobacterium JSC-12]
MVISSAVILLIASTVRHGLLHSHAWDLGIFDQPLYLLSQGLPPISTIVNIHILGDHAAWIFYPLSLLYRIYPDVHWLFLVQAIALATAAIPLLHLAQQAGLKEHQATAIAAVYLLYPLVFNLNLFDFHPEVIALPLLFAAVLAARSQHILWFVVCVVIILGCRDALSLTVSAMGVWLWVFEQRRVYGAIAFSTGIVWFILATQVILPHFQPAGVLGTSHFAEFGKTIPEILLNILLRPDLLLRKLITLPNLGYLLLLLSPLAWGLSVRHLAPLVAAIPQLAINLLSTSPALKDMVHQYSLPIVPFLFLAVIATVAAGDSWIQRPRRMVLWSLVTFVALAQWSLFGTRFLSTLDTWQASRDAIAQITTRGAVLAPAALVPHLTHRQVIKVVAGQVVRLDDYDYLLFNRRHPGRMTTPEIVTQLIESAHQDPSFRLRYERDDVYLFSRASLTAASRTSDSSPTVQVLPYLR